MTERKRKLSIWQVGIGLRQYTRPVLTPISAALLLALAGVFFTLLGPVQISCISQHIQDGLSGSIDLQAVGDAGLRLAVIYGISALCGFLQQFLMSSAAVKLAHNLMTDLCRRDSDDPSCRINDVQRFSRTVTFGLSNLISSGAQLVGCMVMMFAIEWRVGLLAVGAFVLGIGLIIPSMRGARRCYLLRQVPAEALNGYVEEIYTGHDVVRLYRAGRQVKEHFRELNGAMYAAERRGMDMTLPLTMLAGNLGYVAVCVCGAVLATGGVIGFGDIAALIIYVWLFSASLTCLWQCIPQLQEGAAAVGWIVSLLSE